MDVSPTTETQEAPGLREAPDAGRPAMGYVDRAELRELYERVPRRVWRDSIGTWAAILAALAVAALWPHPLALLAAFAVVGSRQLALSHLVHDASHFNISRNKRLNDWISDLFFAAPTLISTATYRTQHLAHHAYLGEATRDSDVRTWYALRGWKGLRRVAITLLGGEALKTAMSYGQSGRVQASADTLRQAALVVGTNGLLLGYCAWLGAAWVYFALWLLPLFTVTVLLLTLRVIAEHQSLSYARAARDDFERDMTPTLARTIEAGPVGRFILGPMNFCYHHEHHLFPAVPYAHLPELHRRLVERGYFADREQELSTGYGRVLLSLFRPPPAASGSAAHDSGL